MHEQFARILRKTGGPRPFTEVSNICRDQGRNRNTAHVECKNKCDTSNNRGDWKHLKIIQKIPEQRTGKARNEVTTESSHIGHCTHTAESADVKV
jgi:hypothetical protein